MLAVDVILLFRLERLKNLALDEVEGLHNRREFCQRLECLYQAMQTQEISFLLLL